MVRVSSPHPQDPLLCTQEIAAMIDTEFAKQTSLDAVAQAVVDRVRRIHGDTFASGGERAKFCPRHEDMTLLVRNFGYPLGELSQSAPSPAPGIKPSPGGLFETRLWGH